MTKQGEEGRLGGTQSSVSGGSQGRFMSDCTRK